MGGIEIEIIDMKAQKLIRNFGASLHINNDSLLYKHHFEAEFPIDEEDMSLGWKEAEIRYVKQFVMKSETVAIELWFTKNEQWAVNVVVNSGDDICFYYNLSDKEKAENAFQTLMDWRKG